MSEQENRKITLTLDPDNATDTILAEAPTMKSVAANIDTDSSTEFSAGTVDESMLSEEEREQVETFAREIDIANVDQVVRYGEAAQKNISDFSVSILKKVKTQDLGEIGDSLKELTVAIDATTEPEKKGLLGVFQKAKRGIGSIQANYAKAESNVDKIEKDLIKHKEVLIQDISMYQQMYELNTEYYKQLTMYIIAGKKALDAAEKGKLLELKEKAETSGKQEDTQAYNDFKELCHRFSKKISDLETTRMISIQAAPQVRMIQNNDRMLMDELQASLSNTIPTWRNQLVISLGLEHSKRALEAQSTLREKTNELLAKNSETLKMATIESAKEAERPIVDVETLQKCNRDLITSINEVVKIHEQGTMKREQAREQLVKMEEDLKQAMLEARR
ncbi:toxic anion resistance family protein [Butyrivibrio proteoclasticus B316]|uniref:Toxic anion resistance family protein n=1 Tax=Butyrivibrio proteoclasticus (strain ATCC 51982 / DSM 14932 / B316) TaxID=515622 RepID=E0RWV3_BUTPB|nr:toxic anion resistance protein [Butyrivibrio proteoclasticus]ADL34629.1 toxic anion resistance family protein [Butyrivibrio proteoclasticus B316]